MWHFDVARSAVDFCQVTAFKPQPRVQALFRFGFGFGFGQAPGEFAFFLQIISTNCLGTQNVPDIYENP